MGRLTHASFFSGVGGADLGLERAGWRTVSVSEIEPYASSVLARHWPDAPNLGDIVALAAAETGVERVRRDFDPHRVSHGADAEGLVGAGSEPDGQAAESLRRGSADGGDDRGADALARGVEPGSGSGLDLDQPDAGGVERDAPGALSAVDHASRGGGLHDRLGTGGEGVPWGSDVYGQHEGGPGDGGEAGRGGEWHDAILWSGGFPCQDLSVAGKRRGFGGERSVLAFAFLALVERHRPPAILLENVPGLLSSNAGRDFYALQRRMAELGYGVAYRVLDAQFFGVPQRRRRVFILGLRSGENDPDGRVASERAAEILSVGTRCPWHPTKGPKTWPGPTAATQEGARQDRVTGSVDTRSGAPTSQSVSAGFLTPDAPDIVGSLSANGDGGRAGQDANAGQVFAVDLGTRGGDARRRDERDAEGNADPRSAGRDSGASADADRVREADGLAGWMDRQPDVEGVVGFSQNQRGEIVTHEVAHQLTTGGGKPGEGYPAVMVDQEQASALTASFGKSRGVSAGKGGPPANVVYVEDQALGLNTAQRDNPETNTFVEGPVVYQGHGTNVGPMGALRAGNGNETGGVPFMEVAAPLEASDGHHGHGSPRGDGADNIVVDEFSFTQHQGGVSVTGDQVGALRTFGGVGNQVPYIARAVNSHKGSYDPDTDTLGEVDGFALRVGPRSISEGGPGDTVPVIEAEGFATSKFAQYDGEMPLLRAAGGDLGGGSEALVDVGNYYQRDRVYGDQAPTLDAHAHNATDAPMAWANSEVSDEDDMLPDGLDSHRYRCCGNGVVANVADWIGQRLAQEFA